MRYIVPLLIIPFIIYATSLHVWYAIYEHDIELQIEFTNHRSSIKLEGVLFITIYVDNKLYHTGRFIITKENYSEDNWVVFNLPKPSTQEFKIVVKFFNGKYRLKRTIMIKNDD